MGITKANAVTGMECKLPTNGGVFIAEYSQNCNPDPRYGMNPFSVETPGNEVDFFTTGEEYFADIAEKIKAARKSIFITGWQIDFDVMLTNSERLYDCLSQALNNNKELRVYVMPWASPKVPVDTHDLETLCALSLLNAGKEEDGSERKMRVFVLPAISQADQGLLAVGFSHHQKSIVIDNEIAYIGGLDLAYGRRDDNSFSLKWNWREGCERYNPCIPPVDTIKSTDERFYLTTMELITSAAMEGDKLSIMSRKISELRAKFGDKKEEIEREFKEWVNNSPNIKKVVDELDRISKEVNTVFNNVSKAAKEKARNLAIEMLKRVSLKPPEFIVDYVAGAVPGTKIGSYQSKASIMLAFLSGQSLEDVPPEVWEETAEDMRVFSRRLYTMCLYLSDVQGARYSYLTRKHTKDGKESYYYMLPPGGKLHAAHQPRMPWQDVHSRIKGPTVFDLSMNFVRRWNSLQARMHAEDKTRATQTISENLLSVIEFFLGTYDKREYRKKIREDVRKLTEKAEKAIEENQPKAKALGNIALENAKRAQAEVAAAGRQLRADVDGLLDKLVEKNTLTQQQVDTFRSQLDQKLDEYKAKAKGGADSVVEAVESIKEDGRRFVAAVQKAPEPIYIPKELLPKRTPGTGKYQLQVLRSASRRMIRDEYVALEKSLNGAPDNLLAKEKVRFPVAEAPRKGEEDQTRMQDNCYEAIVNAITNAVHFVYIEGQFFLSGHGRCDKVSEDVFSGPMGQMYSYERIKGFHEWNSKLGGTLSKMLAGESPDIRKIDGAVLLRIRLEDPEFYGKLKSVILNRSAINASNRVQSEKQKAIKNRVGDVLAARIKRAIYGGENFHAYIVVPIHPEGNLGDFSLMSMVHFTMQSLFNGEDSLVARVQRSIHAKRLIDAKKADGVDAAEALARKLNREELEKEVPETDWMKYLTILNLRNWDDLGKGPVTEQIYIHSKLVITDDRYAFLGSANINDRSLLGDRDSEIGLLIKDGNKVNKPITGGPMIEVSEGIHNLRVKLWRKHFGLAGGSLGKIGSASDLGAVLDKPADPNTWKAIQKVATRNLEAYSAAFYYIPRNNADGNPACQNYPEEDTRPQNIKDKDPVRGKRGSSIWTTWKYKDVYDHLKGGEMTAWLPFEEAFWRTDEERKKIAKENDQKPEKLEMRERPAIKEPAGVKGFIVAMPWRWTAGENNDSGLNKLIIAYLNSFDGADGSRTYVADAGQAGDSSKGIGA